MALPASGPLSLFAIFKEIYGREPNIGEQVSFHDLVNRSNLADKSFPCPFSRFYGYSHITLVDNRISISTAIYNGSGLIQATSTYPVTSTITISGEWQDDLTGRGTFSITIPAGDSAGSTEVYLSSSYVVNFYVDSAGANPSSDDTYSYTLYN